MSSDTASAAKIRGLPDFPSVTEINVRSGPGTNYPIAFKAPVGKGGLGIAEVTIDNEGKNLNGKVYQWFRLSFDAATSGWVRDDLIFIQGDCSAFGYGLVPPDTFAFALTRQAVTTPAPEPATKTATPMQPAAASNVEPLFDLERVQKAALNITMAFEGSGYDAYNNYDAGIISYGIIQFTLAAGSLVTVLNNYLARANSQNAAMLRTYQPRIQAQDASLRNDEHLKSILLAAAREPEMQQVQDALAISNYWNRTVDNFIRPRDYKYPLTYALLFDISVNFGVGDGFVRMAERDLGVPARSIPANVGVTEQQIITRVTELRKISHDKQAVRDNLPGLRARGDFWVKLTQTGDWNLMGDDKGLVYPNAKPVQVRNT